MGEANDLEALTILRGYVAAREAHHWAERARKIAVDFVMHDFTARRISQDLMRIRLESLESYHAPIVAKLKATADGEYRKLVEWHHSTVDKAQFEPMQIH